jgi:hypothetical protein
VLAGPAMARHVIVSTDGYAQSIFCATSEAGNPTASIAITWHGVPGGSMALGTARSTMLAGITQAMCRENAAGHTHEVIVCPANA